MQPKTKVSRVLLKRISLTFDLYWINQKSNGCSPEFAFITRIINAIMDETTHAQSDLYEVFLMKSIDCIISEFSFAGIEMIELTSQLTSFRSRTSVFLIHTIIDSVLRQIFLRLLQVNSSAGKLTRG